MTEHKYTLTSEQADEKYGAIIWVNASYVIRINEVERDGDVHIVAHDKVDGREQFPLGYMLGLNALHTRMLE